MRDYSAFGGVLRSEIEFPELSPAIATNPFIAFFTTAGACG